MNNIKIAKQLIKISKELIALDDNIYENWRDDIIHKIIKILRKYNIGLVGIGDSTAYFNAYIDYLSDQKWFNDKFKNVDMNDIQSINFRIDIVDMHVDFVGLSCCLDNNYFNKNIYMNNYNGIFKQIYFQDFKDEKSLKELQDFVKNYFKGLKLSLRSYVHCNY